MEMDAKSFVDSYSYNVGIPCSVRLGTFIRSVSCGRERIFDSVVLELTQAAGQTGRVNLTYKGSPLSSLVKGPVIDEVSYDSSNSQLLTVNNQGNITLSNGYTFASPDAPGVPVTITARRVITLTQKCYSWRTSRTTMVR